MITCVPMDKSQKERWLPILFDVLYENMSQIAPSSLSYQEDRFQWIAEVSPALDKAPRQIILCLNDSQLLGYIQYYTRGSLLMIEEIQIIPAYHRTLLFHRMCRALYRYLTVDIEHIEAFVDIRNQNSHHLMNKLGFRQINQSTDSQFIHLRADAAYVKSRLIKAQ